MNIFNKNIIKNPTIIAFIIIAVIAGISSYYDCEIINSIINISSSSSSIVGFALGLLIYYKISTILHSRNKTREMISAMQENNKFYQAGLNMEIDITSPAIYKIAEIRKLLTDYKSLAEKLSNYIDNLDKTVLWEERTLGIKNTYSKLTLVIAALEIQILELEIANKSCPLSSDIENLKKKRDEFIKYSSKTGYID